MNFAGFVMHWENPTCQFEMVGPPDWLNLWQIENQTHGYVDLALLAVVEVFADDTNLERKKKLGTLHKNFPELNPYCPNICTIKYQFGCGISKMVGPKKQDFCPRINILKGKKNRLMDVSPSKIDTRKKCF